MSEELYIGVDVSKKWLDLAYYDGVDFKDGKIVADGKHTFVWSWKDEQLSSELIMSVEKAQTKSCVWIWLFQKE